MGATVLTIKDQSGAVFSLSRGEVSCDLKGITVDGMALAYG